jgi:hypothetical protein
LTDWSMADVRPEIEYATSTKYFGSEFHRLTMSCAMWPWQAKEIYEGEFGGKTPTGILFIGNTYDVSTSMNSVNAMGDLFEGSVVLEQHGFGVCLSLLHSPFSGTVADIVCSQHTSLAQASECSGQIIAEYFLNGTLPEKGKVCEVDVSLF